MDKHFKRNKKLLSTQVTAWQVEASSPEILQIIEFYLKTEEELKIEFYDVNSIQRGDSVSQGISCYTLQVKRVMLCIVLAIKATKLTYFTEAAAKKSIIFYGRDRSGACRGNASTSFIEGS